MSRSYKKTQIFGNSKSSSEKQDKKISHGMFRARERNALNSGNYDDVPEKMTEVLDEWSMDKDGKHYYADAESKDMRK